MSPLTLQTSSRRPTNLTGIIGPLLPRILVTPIARPKSSSRFTPRANFAKIQGCNLNSYDILMTIVHVGTRGCAWGDGSIGPSSSISAQVRQFEPLCQSMLRLPDPGNDLHLLTVPTEVITRMCLSTVLSNRLWAVVTGYICVSYHSWCRLHGGTI